MRNRTEENHQYNIGPVLIEQNCGRTGPVLPEDQVGPMNLYDDETNEITLIGNHIEFSKTKRVI